MADGFLEDLRKRVEEEGEFDEFFKWVWAQHGFSAAVGLEKDTYKNTPLYSFWVSQDRPTKKITQAETITDESQYGVKFNSPREGAVTLPNGRVSSMVWWNGLSDQDKLETIGARIEGDVIVTPDGKSFTRESFGFAEGLSTSDIIASVVAGFTPEEEEDGGQITTEVVEQGGFSILLTKDGQGNIISSQSLGRTPDPDAGGITEFQAGQLQIEREKLLAQDAIRGLKGAQFRSQEFRQRLGMIGQGEIDFGATQEFGRALEKLGGDQNFDFSGALGRFQEGLRPGEFDAGSASRQFEQTRKSMLDVLGGNPDINFFNIERTKLQENPFEQDLVDRTTEEKLEQLKSEEKVLVQIKKDLETAFADPNDPLSKSPGEAENQFIEANDRLQSIRNQRRGLNAETVGIRALGESTVGASPARTQTTVNRFAENPQSAEFANLSFAERSALASQTERGFVGGDPYA